MAGPFYFAWCGGTLQEPVTLATSGHTHGGQIETVTLVGDIQVGSALVQNIASNVDATAGELNQIEGPGIAPGTFFIVEEALAGPTDSLNLNGPASATLRGAMFKVTKSVPVDTGVATFSAGSNVVLLDPAADLSPGWYGATSTVIGKAGGIDVGSAALYYDGASGTMIGFQAVSVGGTTTYTVEPVDIVALASGDFPLRLTGLPSADWYSVSSIPEAHLASLTPGLVYNIAGNGIANGTTFVAPDGGTTITLSLPATSAERALLTITGPRTPNAPFDPAVHNRFDENVIDIEIAQEEGGFATLKCKVKNPAVGLLAPGRNLWCWLSWDLAWTSGGTASPNLFPLFNGRLVGVPRLAADEIVDLEFIARPDDFIRQKAALGDALSVLPWYDPIWLTTVNPDTVLESYSALWHIDRTTLELSVSDIVQGEDGIVEVGEGQSLYDGFSLAYGQPPLNSVSVSGMVGWSQQGSGVLDVTTPLARAFSDAGSPLGNGSLAKFPANNTFSLGNGARIKGGGALIACLAGDGLKSDWPKPGTSIGGGWSLSTENDASGVPLCFVHDATWLGTPVTYNVDYFGKTQPATKGSTVDETEVNVFHNANGIGLLTAAFPVSNFKIRMMLQYKADRKRTETVRAVLMGGVQPVLSDSSESDREEVNLTSEYVAHGIDPGGEIPIGSLGYKSYFQTARGAASFEYLLLAARAKLRARARAVDVTFLLNWTDAIGLGIGLRNSVTLFDRRLPGGSATGKVKSYRLSFAAGVQMGEFTIGCTVGTGYPATAAAGVNSYVEDDYVDDYQVMAGGQIEIIPAEIAYQALDDFVVSDDGVNLANITVQNAVNSCTVVNGLTAQTQALSLFQLQEINGPNPVDKLKEMTTTVTLDMQPLNGSEFHTDFFPALTHLALPMTIDLGARSDVPMSLWDHPDGAVWDSGSSTWDETHAQPN